MKRQSLILGCTWGVLSAVVACASSEDDASPITDAGPSPLADAAIDRARADDGAPTAVPTCSNAGWCLTPLPDSDLDLKDVWPFESRAFAIAESPTLGVKVLEWDETAKTWSYIDDDSQNTFEFDTYAGKIWAPSDNELYFGAAPAFIYHGKRAAPSSPWSWQRSQLADNSRDPHPDHDPGRVSYQNRYGLARATALGVWGTSADDVYAWYANTIFHWKSDGWAGPGWVAEYIAEDTENPADTFFVFGAAGSSGDDVWFAGGRGRYNDFGIFRCPIVVQRTASGYRRLVDNVIDDTDIYSQYDGVCRPKDGALTFSRTVGSETTPWMNAGWLTNIESAGRGRAVGIVGEDLFAYVEPTDAADGGIAGVARVNRVAAQVPRDLLPSLVNWTWVHGTETWLSGWGLVLRTPSDPARWSTGLGLFSQDDIQELEIDAGMFTFSSTSINGAPLDQPLNQVRGTSNTNLWAIGFHHALHKTTP